MKLLNAGKMMLKKDYAFDGVPESFDEIDNNRHKPNDYNPRTSNTINRKNRILEYLNIMEWKLLDVVSTPTIVRKINNDNCKGHANKKLNEEISSGDICRAEIILFASIYLKMLTVI